MVTLCRRSLHRSWNRCEVIGLVGGETKYVKWCWHFVNLQNMNELTTNKNPRGGSKMNIFIPLLPVTTGTFLGLDRISKMIGFCTQGIKKWVPSPTTNFLIPVNRSKITARWPPSTEINNNRWMKVWNDDASWKYRIKCRGENDLQLMKRKLCYDDNESTLMKMRKTST